MSGQAAVDPGIFKAYDVRGLYGEQIDDDVAYRIGRAFARVIADMEGTDPSNLELAVGRDMRLSAPELVARYIEGIRDEGADVIDIGQVGTEQLYYTVGSRDLPGARGRRRRGQLHRRARRALLRHPEQLPVQQRARDGGALRARPLDRGPRRAGAYGDDGPDQALNRRAP